jgi:hypothetical protein
MQSLKPLLIGAAGLAITCSMALAGPGEKDTSGRKPFRGLPNPNPPAIGEQPTFTENFDSYTAGAGISGLNGWEVWYSGGGDGMVDTAQANSAPNGFKMVLSTDMVQRQTITSGVWEFSIMTYVPSTAPPGDGISINILNQYGGPDNWSMQIALNENFFSGSQPIPYMIESQWDGALLPLKLDQWVELKAVIDLDNDTWDSWYGGDPLGVGLIWTDNGFSGGPGITEIAVIDLWTSSSLMPPTAWVDDISLAEVTSCPCACNVDTSTGPGVCDIFDFLGFQNGFVAGDPCMCDVDVSTGPGVCDIFDFLAFQNQFVGGCP